MFTTVDSTGIYILSLGIPRKVLGAQRGGAKAIHFAIYNFINLKEIFPTVNICRLIIFHETNKVHTITPFRNGIIS